MTKKLMLVGLCGRSGSGKGYVSNIFETLGIPSVDTDIVYREITGPSESLSDCMISLAERFGRDVIAEDNSLNRPYLRKIVFSDNAEALRDLNKITHKFILDRTLHIAEDLRQKGFPIVLIDAPLLFESGFNNMCRVNICVTAPEEIIVKRIVERDGISYEEAHKRLASQKKREELEAISDFIIFNNTENNELIEQVSGCVQKLTEIYRKEYEYEI